MLPLLLETESYATFYFAHCDEQILILSLIHKSLCTRSFLCCQSSQKSSEKNNAQTKEIISSWGFNTGSPYYAVQFLQLGLYTF